MTVTYLRTALCIVTMTACTLIVAGCASVAEKDQPEAAEANIDTPPPTVATASPAKPRLSRRDAYIAQLLYQAADAIDRDRLTTPSYDNAFDYYRKVLELDPRNQAAVIGIERITRRYLALAAYAEKHGDQKQQDRYMSIARVVSPSHPLVRQWQRKVQQRPKIIARQPEPQRHAIASPEQGALHAEAPAKAPVDADAGGDTGTDAANTVAETLQLQHRYKLDRRDLSARNVGIKSVLSGIAQHARSQQSRLLIVARNDAEGRWIYQQMREAVKGFRLRGNIEYDAKPSIVLLDVESQSD